MFASTSDYFVNSKKDGNIEYTLDVWNGVQSKIGLKTRELWLGTSVTRIKLRVKKELSL